MTQQSEALEIAPRELIEDEPVTVPNACQIWVEESDPTPDQSMRLVELSGSLDFWLDAAEDIYGPDDGTPV